MYSKDNRFVDDVQTTATKDTVFVKSDVYNEGIVLFFQHFHATFCKRFLQQWRKKWLLLIQWCLLAIIVGGSLLLNHILARYQPVPPAKPLTIENYKGSNMILSADHNSQLFKIVNTVISQAGLKEVEPDLDSDRVPIIMSDYILGQSSKSGVVEFMDSNYIALSVSQTNSNNSFVGYFNKKATHSSSTVLNLIDNLILKNYCNSCSLETENFPLPQTTIVYYRFGEDFVIVLCLAIGLAFLVTNFSTSIVEERVNGAKHMQILAGLNPFVYWLATLAWDGPIFVLCSGCIVLIWWLGGCQLLVEDGAWLDMLLTFVLHGWAILPFNYLLSVAYSSTATAITATTAVNLLLNLVPTITVTTLAALSGKDESLKTSENLITDICSSVLPQFTLSKTISTYYTNRLMTKQCKAMKACDFLKSIESDQFKITETPLQWESPGIGRYLTCLCAQGFVCLVILALTEWWQLSLKHYFSKFLRSNYNQESDIEMIEKSNNIVNDSGSKYILDVQDLFVRYNNYSKPAVAKLCFRVERGEIFGLNGENGSGKTTTYKILTGQLIPNSGAAFINNIEAVKNWRQATLNVGFCPQADCLLEFLTAKESLVHFCRLKGIHGNDINDISESILKAVGLIQYKNRIVKRFSGGNKRKLSLAIALIGAPPLLLLDEPTCGVDPRARRKIWKVLQIMKTLGCGIVLTSHDMEECETLCNRLMIMVEGKCKSTGSPQSLLEKYAKVLNLRLTVDHNTDLELFKAGVLRLFKQAELKAQPNPYQFHYTVPLDKVFQWSTAFKYIEMLKEFFVITDFALTQPTLHEVFVSIVKKE